MLREALQGHIARQPVKTRPIGSTGTLPDGLIAWREFAERHAIPDSTVKDAIERGKLTIVRGNWKQDGSYIKGALDESGRRTFVKLWGHRPDFARCAECPHELRAPSAPDQETVPPAPHQLVPTLPLRARTSNASEE